MLEVMVLLPHTGCVSVYEYANVVCFAYTQPFVLIAYTVHVITIKLFSENPIATHPVVTADTTKSIMSPVTFH